MPRKAAEAAAAAQCKFVRDGLIVRVYRATGLRNAGTATDPSDPKAVVLVTRGRGGKAKSFVTPHVDNTLEPTWGPDKEGKDGVGHRFEGIDSDNAKLRVVVKDHNSRWFDHELGTAAEFKIGDQELPEGGEEKRIQLKIDPQGSIEIGLAWSVIKPPSMDDPQAFRKLLKMLPDWSIGGRKDAAVMPPNMIDEKTRTKMADADQTPSGGRVKMAAGEWVVEVHIIECKDMQGNDASGVGDLCFFVETLGCTRTTQTEEQSASAVYDQKLFFAKQGCEETYLENATVALRAMDMNTFSRNSLIGQFEAQLSDLYCRGMLRRRWLALTNPAKPKKGVTGYVKVSMQCCGPDDQLEPLPEAEEGEYEQPPLIPPTMPLKLHRLVVTLWRAEGLRTPKGATDISPHVELCVGGHHIKSRTEMSGVFRASFWFPLLLPDGGTRLLVSVWKGGLTENTMLGADFIDVADTPVKSNTNGLSGMRWVQLAAPLNADSEKLAKTTAGGVWTGALLIAVELRAEESDLGLKEDKVFIREMNELGTAQEPPTAPFEVHAAAFLGNSMPSGQTMSVQVTWGKYQWTHTGKAPDGSNVCQWLAQLALTHSEERTSLIPMRSKAIVDEEVRMPDADSPELMPDFLVYLCLHESKLGVDSVRRLAFKRLRAAEVLRSSPNAPPFWLSFDYASSELWPAEKPPPSVLLRLAVVPADREEAQWRSALAYLHALKPPPHASVFSKQHMGPLELRLHVYVARGFKGSTDAYVRLTYCGVEAVTEVLYNRARPQWLQTLRLVLPSTYEPSVAPAVDVTVLDDNFISDEILGRCSLDLRDAMQSVIGGQTGRIEPAWTPLLKSGKSTGAELLLRLEVLRAAETTAGKEEQPSEDAKLEVLAQMSVEEPKTDGDDVSKPGSPTALSKDESNLSEKLNAVAGEIDKKIAPLVKQATTGLGGLSTMTENLVSSAGSAAGALGAKAANAASEATAALNKVTDEIAAATEAQAKAVQDIKLRPEAEPMAAREKPPPSSAELMDLHRDEAAIADPVEVEIRLRPEAEPKGTMEKPPPPLGVELMTMHEGEATTADQKEAGFDASMAEQVAASPGAAFSLLTEPSFLQAPSPSSLSELDDLPIEQQHAAKRETDEGHTANREGRYADARKHFLAASELDPSRALAARISAANMALKAGSPSVAMIEYEQLVLTDLDAVSPRAKQLVNAKLGEAREAQARIDASSQAIEAEDPAKKQSNQEASSSSSLAQVETPFSKELSTAAASDQMLVAVAFSLRAEELIAMDKNLFGGNSSDPYFKLLRRDANGILVEICKSNTVIKSLNPVWEKVEVPAKVLSEHRTLQMEVYDHDIIGKDDLLGVCDLKLPDFQGLLQQRTYESTLERCKLSTDEKSSCGAVEGTLSLVVKSASAPISAPMVSRRSSSILSLFGGSSSGDTSAAPPDPPLPDLRPATQKAFVQVLAVGARGLIDVGVWAPRRPHLDLNVGERKVKVAVKELGGRRDGHNPNFNTSQLLDPSFPQEKSDMDLCPPLEVAVSEEFFGGLKYVNFCAANIDLASRVSWLLPEPLMRVTSAIVELQCLDRTSGTWSSTGCTKGGWIDAATGQECPKAKVALRGPLWAWENEWTTVDVNAGGGSGRTDREGWSYAGREDAREWSAHSAGHSFRRRRWERTQATSSQNKPKAMSASARPTADSNDAVVIEMEPEWHKGRAETALPLEETFSEGSHTFEAFPLYKEVGSAERVGTLKGLVRVLKRKQDAEKGLPADLPTLLTPKRYRVRLYVLQASSLFPADECGTSDAYLKVRLAGEEQGSRDLALFRVGVPRPHSPCVPSPFLRASPSSLNPLHCLARSRLRVLSGL